MFFGMLYSITEHDEVLGFTTTLEAAKKDVDQRIDADHTHWCWITYYDYAREREVQARGPFVIIPLTVSMSF